MHTCDQFVWSIQLTNMFWFFSSFVVELKKQSSCSVQLTNNTYHYVAFKVRTMPLSSFQAWNNGEIYRFGVKFAGQDHIAEEIYQVEVCLQQSFFFPLCGAVLFCARIGDILVLLSGFTILLEDLFLVASRWFEWQVWFELVAHVVCRLLGWECKSVCVLFGEIRIDWVFKFGELNWGARLGARGGLFADTIFCGREWGSEVEFELEDEADKEE